MLIALQTISQLPEAAKQLLTFSGNEKVFLFFGDMGSGKTTFIKSICQELGVQDMVSSPTYTIVNEYVTNHFSKLYHFDFYRLKTETEALDLGFEDYLYSNSYCFIEWPENIRSYWPKNYIKIALNISSEMERTIFAETI